MELNLIIPCEQDWTGSFEIIDDRPWRLSGPLENTTDGEPQSYRTISYTWGQDTSPNLFGLPSLVSSRTFRALEAVIKATVDSDIQAYWIDAVCIPVSGSARLATLEAMGYIYHRASAGVVVLEQPVFDIISCSHHDKRLLTVSEMEVLDKDRWVTSVWTYQELVNAGAKTFFTTYDMEAPAQQEASILFDILGGSMERWRIDGNKSYQEVLGNFSGLSVLEDTLADWQMGLYLNISALTCITGIAKRKCAPDWPTNRLYALFGVITQEPSWGSSANESVASLTEKAMQIFEAKHDYSFIYTSNPREQQGNRQWRPQPDEILGLVPLLLWHSWGDSQPGVRHTTGLLLQQMIPLDTSQAPSDEAVQSGVKWVANFTGNNVKTLPEQLPAALASIGLRRGAYCHECATGVILLQDKVSPTETLEAYASSTVRWVFGAPGIAKVLRHGVCQRYVVLVFFGLPPDQSQPRVTVELED